jgi:hypothetical protein
MFRADTKQTFGRIGVAVLILGLAIGAVSCAHNAGNEPAFHKAKPVPPDKITKVGMDVCTNCHPGQTAQWMTGQHSNSDGGDLNSEGFPSYVMFGTNDTCQLCHDQLGDGHRLVPLLTGNVPRPVIGCESCHGGGAEHFGVGPIPYPKPNYQRCGQCHSASFPASHLPYHPNGDNIVEDYENSKHFQSINEHTLVQTAAAKSKTVLVNALCSRCHTDDGFKLYQDTVLPTMSHDAIIALLADEPPLTNPDPVGCFTCHDPHTTIAGDLTRIKASTLLGNNQSGEYNTCTDCHQLNGADGQVLTVGAFHDPAVNPHGSVDEIINDNHAPVPGDTRINTGPDKKFLYFVKKGDPSACALCHNPHRADKTINEQYLHSAHGDALGDPWTHYAWKNRLAGPSTRESRTACQRCHTTTGFTNFANHPGTYNPEVDNYPPSAVNFSYLLDGTTIGQDSGKNWIWADNGQMETLYCWGCHTDYKGRLRNPGAFNITAIEGANYLTMSNAAITFPDASGSNVCIACHSGRVSGGGIANLSGKDFSNLAFQNSHYLAAAGTLYKTVGYEYPSLDYTNVPYFEHDIIGTPAGPAGTGSFGPCIGCHMLNNPAQGVGPNKVSHLFVPVTVSAGDTITSINTTTCAVCHNGEHEMTAAALDTYAKGYDATLEAMVAVLGETRNFWFANCYPYFFKTPADAAACNAGAAQKNWLSAGDAVTDGSVTGKKNMGAAFNLNVLEHEGGACAHNRIYTQRLIYDSIDWIDDNVINDSVATTLNALNPATHPYKDAAIAWLLGASGGARP